jgi:hypothetical protein
MGIRLAPNFSENRDDFGRFGGVSPSPIKYVKSR